MYSPIHTSGHLHGLNAGLGRGNSRVWITALIIATLNKSMGSKSSQCFCGGYLLSIQSGGQNNCLEGKEQDESLL